MIQNYDKDEGITRSVMFELLLSLKRSGADVIITYAAIDVDQSMNKKTI